MGDMSERVAWLFELPCTHRHVTQERADVGCVQNTQPALLREVIKQARFVLLTIQGYSPLRREGMEAGAEWLSPTAPAVRKQRSMVAVVP